MKKTLLSLIAVLLLASFTTINDSVILKDIDGTLLKSYVTLQTTANQNTATFTVDANTIVTSVTDENGTHIYLIENGNSGIAVQHTVTFNTARIGFVNYFETSEAVAAIEGTLSNSVMEHDKPMGVLDPNQ